MMGMSIRGALLLACALTAVASADTPQETADKLFVEGRELLVVKKDAKAACEKFEAAISLDATATGTMLNLGLCYETLGKYATSIAWFRKARNAASEAHLDEYEAAATTHTQTIAGKVPSLQVTIDPKAELWLDGKKIAATEYGKVELDPGPHELVATSPGMKKVVQKLDVAESEARPVTISFTDVAVPVYVDRGKGRKRGAIVLGAAGVAAMIFSGVYGYLGRQSFDDVLTDPKYPDRSSQDKRQGEIKDRVFYVGTGAFILGSAAVVAAGVLFFTAPGKEQVSDGTAFAPVVTGDSVGFAASGSF